MNKNELALNTLKSIIGASLYAEVCDKMPGIDIHIPAFRGGFVTIKERNQAIRREIYNNGEIPEVAEKYRLSQAQIYKILESRD
ncbi:Mor transcription activator family protein [Gemmiger formicilis]